MRGAGRVQAACAQTFARFAFRQVSAAKTAQSFSHFRDASLIHISECDAAGLFCESIAAISFGRPEKYPRQDQDGLIRDKALADIMT